MAAEGPSEGLWDIDDLADFLKVSVASVYYLRHQRKGPPALKVGRELRWDPTVVKKWAAERTEQEPEALASPSGRSAKERRSARRAS